MRRRLALTLTLILLAAPAGFAVPSVDETPAPWLERLADWVVSMVTGADGEPTDPETNLGPWMDPDGVRQPEEPSSPDGALGPWMDPNG